MVLVNPKRVSRKFASTSTSEKVFPKPPLRFYSDIGLSNQSITISAQILLADSSENGLEASALNKAQDFWRSSLAYQPKTPLGKKLWAIRQKAIASGMSLLDWSGIEKEIAERKGEELGS